MGKIDFEIFKKEAGWHIKSTDLIELTQISPDFSDNFISTFPTLYKLISQASILDILLTRKKGINLYKLFTWTDINNLKSGWLCKFETNTNNLKILPEHQLLLNNIGGIQETYRQFDTEDEILTDNQNFLFIKSKCTKGLRDWIKLYGQVCEAENAEQIDTENLVCFVGEANGNETFYDLNTKQVLLFAPDHSFVNIEVLNNQPEYTFYTINGVTTFIDYVETLAQQWLDNIVSVKH